MYIYIYMIYIYIYICMGYLPYHQLVCRFSKSSNSSRFLFQVVFSSSQKTEKQHILASVFFVFFWSQSLMPFRGSVNTGCESWEVNLSILGGEFTVFFLNSPKRPSFHLWKWSFCLFRPHCRFQVFGIKKPGHFFGGRNVLCVKAPNLFGNGLVPNNLTPWRSQLWTERHEMMKVEDGESKRFCPEKNAMKSLRWRKGA